MHIHPSSPNSSLSEDDAAMKIQAGWKGYRVRKQMKNSKKMRNGQQNGSSKNASDDQVALEEKSAAKIQAGWKGFKIRKEMKYASAAATKIQANWKGFKTRKEFRNKAVKDNTQ